MRERKIAPCGSWASPIRAEHVAQAAVRFLQVALGPGGAYWVEGRPAEAGRHVIVRRGPDGATTDLLPPPFSARSRVHEYGGGAFVLAGGDVFFSNFADQRLWRADPAGGAPRPVTPEADARYADGVWDAPRGRIICVREDHSGPGQPVNSIVAVDPAGGAVRVLVEGGDFYASPRLSPDARQLAWLTWDHPAMPWDATQLWAAPVLAGGSLGPGRFVAGGCDESVLQPAWSPHADRPVLHFVSDRDTGWWNIHRLRDGRIEPLARMDAEFAGPPWLLGRRSYAFADENTIVCAYTRRGVWQLASLDCSSGELTVLDAPFTAVGDVDARGNAALLVAAGPADHPAVVRIDLATGAVDRLRTAGDLPIDPAYLSTAEPVEFPTEGGLTAHGLFYPPANPHYAPPRSERPPLVVKTHGGPTSSAQACLNLAVQYYTSRGIAVLDVNYGGSTGYGRDYRRRLYGRWGVVDVDDCVNGALWLAGRGRVDRRRMAITGGSAGGYTTLAALTFRDVFAAGASHFGVSDCEALARETHKFESRYLDTLIGPYPQRADLYRHRSPIHHVEDLSCPIIFFQGLEDRIVPPNQAERMVDALRKRNIPVAYLAFEGEQHGFRKGRNIRRAIEAELYFFSRIFGFQVADPVEPVPIDNL